MSLSKNTAWNLIGTGTPFLVGLATIPYLIKHIGVESFGILTLIWTLIGYFSLFDLGLGRALTQQVASCIATKRLERLPSLVKSGLVFTGWTGLIGGLLLAVLSQPLGHSWLKVSSSLQHDTACSLLIAALGIPLTTVTTGLRGVIEAYEDFRGSNILRISLGIANFALPALSVMFFGPSLILIVVTLILARVVIFVAHIRLMNTKLPAGWFKKEANSKDVKNLLTFGVWMTVSNIISPLMVTADRFIISATLGAGLVAYYTVPFEILIRVLILPAALTSALFPRLATLFHAEDSTAAKSLYYRSLKIVTITLLPICLIITLGSYYGLTLWLGKDFAEHSWIIVCILTVGIFLNGIAYVPFSAIQATGNAKITAYFHILELCIYIPLLLLALRLFGLYGAAIVWTIRIALDLSLLLFFAKKLISSHKGFVR
ncbi:MAG: flippase [Gammaproteobacteria bacterium]|nr:flippase [Gammaproteobacteria bacterium]